MMRRKFQSSNEEQDEAFFGPSSTSTQNDEELARKLQAEYTRSDVATATFATIDTTRTRTNDTSRSTQEQQDLELALRLQRQGSGAFNHNGRGGDRRLQQEEEDAKLAKALQEAEELSEPRGIFLPQESRRSNNNNNNTNNTNSSRNKSSATRDHRTINSLVPRCATCDQIVTFPIYALGNIYHRECFKCMTCHGIIQPNESFAVGAKDGREYPFHKECYAETFGMRCTVCQSIIRGDSNTGRVSYIKHPFFEEVSCTTHSQRRRCNGCHRFEPLSVDKQFVDLGDGGRCACYSCCRTIIVDSNDAKPLWDRVLRFMGHCLKLPLFTGISDIPILIVPHDTLNSQIVQNSNHQGSNQIMTRGLCLSEHQIGWNVRLPSMRFDRKIGSMMPSDVESRGHTYFQIPNATKANPQTNVTAILCLSGLPSDLSASILAHEATHAWFKLHPNFDPSRPIPPQVEEGCCQLVAMLFLSDGLEEVSLAKSGGVNDDDSDGPTTEKLRQYFKFCIETDTNEVYGEGYRKAARAYAQIGIEALLSHVVNYREFPKI